MDENYQLSEEEKKILQKHKELAKQSEQKNINFLNNEYPSLTIEEKINYWAVNIRHGMRTQGEATADPYSEFSKEWYNYVKSIEPAFDEIFEKVIPKLRMNFNWEEYRNRIK